MDPQVQPNSNQPVFNQPFQSPLPPAVQPPQVPMSVDPDSESKKKLLIALIVGGVFVVILIIVLIVVVASGGKTPTTKIDPSETKKLQAPQAATANGIQLNDDAISQSLSTLNDDKDFPETKLEDDMINL